MLEETKQQPTVDMSDIAETLASIKTGKRKFTKVEDALQLCKEMFDAGHQHAMASNKRARL